MAKGKEDTFYFKKRPNLELGDSEYCQNHFFVNQMVTEMT